MAEFWASEEYKMIASSSDCLSETLYLREEKKVAINRTLSLSEILNVDSDACLDDKPYDFDLVVDRVSTTKDTPPRSKSPPRKTKAQDKDEPRLQVVEEEEEVLGEETSPASQRIVEENIVPQKDKKEIRTEDTAAQHLAKGQTLTQVPPKKELVVSDTPSGPIIILPESDSQEELAVPKAEWRASEQPKASEKEPSASPPPPKSEALATLPPTSKIPRPLPSPEKSPPSSALLPLREPVSPPQTIPEDKSILHMLFEKTKPVLEIVPRGLQSIMNEIAAIHHHSQTEIATRTEAKLWPKKEEADGAFGTHKGRLLSQRGKDKAIREVAEEMSSHPKPAGKEPLSAMATSLSSFVESPVGQVFAVTIERALSKSEEWLNYYLPVPEANVAPSSSGPEDTSYQDLCKEGCFVRINALSTQLRNRAFKIVLHQIKAARQNAHNNLSLLDQILEMVDYAQTTGCATFSSVPKHMRNLWTQWNTPQDVPSPKPVTGTVKESLTLLPEQLEMRAFLLTRDLARELYHTYQNLLPHISELPAHLQEKVTEIHENLEEMQGYLSSTTNLKDLPSSIVLQSRQKLASARENLDDLLDFMARNSVSHWLPQPSSSRTGKELLFLPASRPREGPASEQKAKGESSGPRPFPHPPSPAPPRP
ncbi:perilipin-3-like [Candoia aspera]|uniref:perilipin-3-like n=1 Tax=Candoia aspera TaxID=51853 RepID=UPI002FD7C089